MNASRIALFVTAAVLVLFAFVVAAKGPAIFQRGNPAPYLIAATQITDERPFAYVDEEDGRDVYIAKRGNNEELISHIEAESGFTVLEQAGAGYIFASGEDRLMAQTEVYWGRWVVWEVPPHS